MKPDPQSFFSKIKAAAEREKLFEDASHSKITVFCKGLSEKIYPLKIIKKEGQTLRCAFIKESLHESQKVIIMMNLGEDKFFFSADLIKGAKQSASLELNEDVYKLQRRSHFRINIPDNLQSHFETIAINGSQQVFKFDIVDVSGGGLRLRTQTRYMMLKKGDTLEGTIKFRNKTNITAALNVRYSRTSRSDKKEFTYIGVMFDPITPQLEHKMSAITMELYRELYTSSRGA